MAGRRGSAEEGDIGDGHEATNDLKKGRRRGEDGLVVE
jgi:hypothetical protein